MACSVSDGLAAFSSVWDGSVRPLCPRLMFRHYRVRGRGAGDEISVCSGIAGGCERGWQVLTTGKRPPQQHWQNKDINPPYQASYHPAQHANPLTNLH